MSFAFISVARKLMLHAANYLFSVVATDSKGKRRRLLKWVMFLSLLSFFSVLEAIFSRTSLVFALLSFHETFYDCSELKCFYVSRKESKKIRWSGNVLLRTLFHRKSFYLLRLLISRCSQSFLFSTTKSLDRDSS